MNLSPEDLQTALDCALDTIQANIKTFGAHYPDDTSTKNVYALRRPRYGFQEGANFGWTTSFWPGQLWLAYELTGEELYREEGEKHLQNFLNRLENEIDLDHHDIGFLYSLACVAPFRITGNERAKEGAIQAAEVLMRRYMPKIGVFQAWGAMDHPEMRGNTIVDSLMNTPLLYWASEQSGDKRFAEAAHRHTSRVQEDLLRPDNTTFHTFYWDVETGAPLRGKTAQGYADASCWARGQAWASYGFALNYRYTKEASFLEAGQRCTDYFLEHLPEDSVVYWDLVFDDGSKEERDSSAAAIAVCALLELSRHLANSEAGQRYQTAADMILASLIANYAPCDPSKSNALLLHSVYSKPQGNGVDEGSLWGDYFYLEGITRRLKPDWNVYW
jgi:unsaturated chondroitin disaccharide hydrolase